MTVHVRLGGTHLDIAITPTGTAASSARATAVSTVPTIVARHRIASPGAGATVRDDGHVTALTAAALAAFTTDAPHRRKERRPPTPAALAEAGRLRARSSKASGASATSAASGSGVGPEDVVVDLARYAAAAAGRNTLSYPRPT